MTKPNLEALFSTISAHLYDYDTYLKHSEQERVNELVKAVVGSDLDEPCNVEHEREALMDVKCARVSLADVLQQVEDIVGSMAKQRQSSAKPVQVPAMSEDEVILF